MFGDSEIPYNKSHSLPVTERGNGNGRVLIMSEVVFKPPVDYTPSLNTPATKLPFGSSIILMGKKIVANSSVSRSSIGTSTATLYTVPDGKTFFLTYAQLELYKDLAGFQDDLIEIKSISGTILSIYDGETASTNLPRSTRQLTNYTTPIVYQVGEEIKNSITVGLSSTGRNDNSIATIIGYEVDNTIVANFT